MTTLLLVLAVAFGVFTLVGAFSDFGPSGGEVAVHTKVPAERVADLPSGAVAPDRVRVLVRVRHASSEQHRWAALRDLVPGVVIVVVLWLLRALLRSVDAGDAFTVRNVQRLRTLAVVLLIGVPIATFVGSIFEGQLSQTAHLSSPGTTIAVPSAVVLGGLALLVLAQVFADGLRLREDVAGTI